VIGTFQLPDFLLLLITTTLTAGLYALASYSLTLIYGVMKIVDVSQGAILTFGIYVAYTLNTVSGLDPILSSVVSFAIFFPYGFFIQYRVARRLLTKYSGGRVLENSLLLFFGVLLALTGLIYLLWKGDIKAINTAYTLSYLELFGLRIYLSRTIIFGYAVAVTLILVYILTRTDTGRAIRAVSQDLESSLVCGVDVDRVFGIAFGLACGISATAGSILTAALAFSPIIGIEFILIAIVVTVIGGMGNFLGAFLGSLAFAVVESFSVLFIGPAYSKAVALAFMVLVLLFRPQGIFGERIRI
jgi:branched-chain amino acid transport system permease protein